MVIIAHLGNAIAQRCSDAASQRYRPPGTCWSPPRLPPGKRLVDLWSRPVVPLLHSTVGPHPGAAAPQMGSGFGGLSHDRPFTAGFGARQGLGKAAGDSTPPRVDRRLLVPMWARAGPPKSHLLVSRERPPRFANKGRNHRPAYPQKIAANSFLCVGCLQHVRSREPPQFPGASALETGPPCRRLLCKGAPCRNEELFGAHVRLSRPLRGFAIKYARGLAVRDEIWSLSSLDSQGQNPVNVAGPLSQRDPPLLTDPFCAVLACSPFLTVTLPAWWLLWLRAVASIGCVGMITANNAAYQPQLDVACYSLRGSQAGRAQGEWRCWVRYSPVRLATLVPFETSPETGRLRKR